MKLKTLIVDDELAARNSLSNFITEYCPTLELVDTAENIVQAEKILKEISIDLLFLDIEMPRGNGFDLLEKLDNFDFEVIFVTAFSQYAVQAFNLSATHYLLKPIDIDELIESVEKAVDRIESKTRNNHTAVLLENLHALTPSKQKIVVPLMEGFEIVKLEKVLYMQADDNFVHIHCTDGKSYMACRSLKFYEDQLLQSDFLRIHRKYLINMDKVKKYLRGKTGFVEMENGKQLEISASKKKDFTAYFQ